MLRARLQFTGSVLCLTLGLAVSAVEGQYTESFQSWSATSAGAWQTKSLAGSPFNVPADAVAEIAIRNSNTTAARFGGVRAVGSALNRYIDMHEATGGGYDVITMHVQTDSSSQIQHYAENTTDVDFVLLGYWDCGIYVESFGTFNGSTAWTDQDLVSYGVGAGHVTEILMVNDAASQAYDAGVRTNGSSLQRRATLQPTTGGNDSVTMLVLPDNSSSATIEKYAGHVNKITFYVLGHWTAAPGAYTEAFTDLGSPTLDGTWEDIDLTSAGVPNLGIADILLSNRDTDEENLMGVRANGSSLNRRLNLRQQNGGGGGDFARMHVLTDSNAVIEFNHQDVSDTHLFLLTGSWDIGVVLTDHPTGPASDAFHETGSATNAELFAFDLVPCAGTLTVTQLVFRLTSINGLVNGDWAGIELLVDTNGDGDIGVSETTSVGGTGTVNQAAGTITFSTSFNVTGQTSYILRADFASLSLGDQVIIGLSKNDITASDTLTGSTTSVTHKEKIECYFESFQAWTPSGADTWQTQSLAGSPYNVPANAVVEIAIRNDNASNERYGGVRAVGSTLERRLLLNQATSGGVDVLVMHVQTDSSSQIQHYADDTTDIDFVLLGYWTCGEYVETFDTFTAGSSASWQDKNLCQYGVGAGYVAEIVMTNDDTGNEREAGVRANGSSLQRRLNIHQASGGGVDTATMFVETDNSGQSTIEVYTEDDTDVDFYLVGYWSEAPLAYNELFTDVGSPASSATWQDVDLTSSGVGDTAHAEFVLANESGTDERNLGIRENGSSLSRFLENQEAQNGGADFSRMHIASDLTATVEWYHSNITSTNSFYLVGHWTTCNATTTYLITDLGAISSTKSSLGHNVNSAGEVAGFEEDSNGDPTAWIYECGSLTGLGTLGGSFGEALGMNDSEVVVGWAHTATGGRRAFSWTSGGGMVNLGVVGSRNASEANGVNSSGEIVGTAVNFSPNPTAALAFLYLPSTNYGLPSGMNSLGTLGGTQSVALDINSSGQVVGGAQNGSGNYRPYRWQSGTMTNLGTLGGETTRPDHRAEAINESGDVVGRSYTSGGARHAFLWDGSMTDLSVLSGGSQSWAFGINDSGVVVGTSDVTGGAFHAFVWDDVHGMRDLNNLVTGGSGWTLTRATDINDDGVIAGWGTNGSGKLRAFLLTPTCAIGGGGSAAAVVLASGSLEADDEGSLEAIIRDEHGAQVAELSGETAPAGTVLRYEVTEPPTDSLGGPGFIEGIAFSRMLSVDTDADDLTSPLTVRMTLTSDQIDSLEVAAEELQLYSRDLGGDWAPAGRNLGLASPTKEVGDCGIEVRDGGAGYWCVVNSGGVFAIGRAEAPVPGDGGEPTPGSPGPRACGVGMLPVLLFCTMFLLPGRIRVGPRLFRAA